MRTRQTKRKKDIQALAEIYGVGCVGLEELEDELEPEPEDDEEGLLEEEEDEEDGLAAEEEEDGLAADDDDDEGLDEEDEDARGSDGMLCCVWVIVIGRW